MSATEQGQFPINELVVGILSLAAILGTVVLAAVGRQVPTVLAAIDTAVIPYYLAARSYNVGFNHGQQDQKEEEPKRE